MSAFTFKKKADREFKSILSADYMTIWYCVLTLELFYNALLLHVRTFYTTIMQVKDWIDVLNEESTNGLHQANDSADSLISLQVRTMCINKLLQSRSWLW